MKKKCVIAHPKIGQDLLRELTPLKAIRWFCKQCCSDDRSTISCCASYCCPLWPYRPYVNKQAILGSGHVEQISPRTYAHTIRNPHTGELMKMKTTADTALKLKCLDCTGGNKTEVRDCSGPTCALYCFRPYQKMKGRGRNRKIEDRPVSDSTPPGPSNGLYEP